MYYILVLALILLLLPLLLNLMTELTREQKRIIYIVFFIFIVLAGVYEYFKDSSGDDNRLKVIAFTQGKTLLCQGNEVNQKEFNFVSGTLTLNGKPDSQYKGILYKISECQIQ